MEASHSFGKQLVVSSKAAKVGTPSERALYHPANEQKNDAFL
jgi:hypothetical protein